MEAVAESSSYSFRRLLRSPFSNQRGNRIHNPVLLLDPYSNTTTSSYSNTRRRQGLGLRCSLPTTSISPFSSSTIGLVLDLGNTESWDSGEVGSPVVKRFVSDDEERWFMWYHGRQTTASNPHFSSVGLAISADGLHWERAETDGPGRVMSQSDNWWAFDTVGVTPSDVIVMSSDKVRMSGSVYWLYYTGISSDTPNNDNWIRSLPGLAMSQDGRHWARIEGDHHSGALFDVGGEGEWDSLFVAGPKVVYHGPGDLRMYYHSFDLESKRYAIGLARSRDGIQWVKLGKVVVAGCQSGMMNAHVVKNRKDGGYIMAYESVSDNGQRRCIGLARSRDGLNDWRRYDDGYDREGVLKPSDVGGWDDTEVNTPYMVEMDGIDEWRLYYRGKGSDGRTGIGMAVSQGKGYSSGFRRWEGFNGQQGKVKN